MRMEIYNAFYQSITGIPTEKSNGYSVAKVTTMISNARSHYIEMARNNGQDPLLGVCKDHLNTLERGWKMGVTENDSK